MPTWNYAVVHAYGRPEVIEDTNWLRQVHVTELAAQQAWPRQALELHEFTEAFIDSMLRAIVGLGSSSSGLRESGR